MINLYFWFDAMRFRNQNLRKKEKHLTKNFFFFKELNICERCTAFIDCIIMNIGSRNEQTLYPNQTFAINRLTRERESEKERENGMAKVKAKSKKQRAKVKSTLTHIIHLVSYSINREKPRGYTNVWSMNVIHM